eukprot:365053-Chlamydomonas_euryale.AAC.20
MRSFQVRTRVRKTVWRDAAGAQPTRLAAPTPPRHPSASKGVTALLPTPPPPIATSGGIRSAIAALAASI